MPPQQRRQPTSGDLTMPEIGRMIEALRDDTTNRLDRIEGKFDRLDSSYVRRDVYDADSRAHAEYQKGVDSRLAALESSYQWVSRTVGGTIITAMIAGIFAASRLMT